MPRKAQRDPAKSENQIGVSLPIPLTGRLDGLLLVAHDAGERTSRRELVCALIAGAPLDPHVLVEWVRAYRRATTGTARIAGQSFALYTQPTRSPGPRRLRPEALPEDDASWAEVENVRLDLMPRVRIGLTVSVALEQRLEQMVEALGDALEKTTRTEVISALILHAPSDADSLSEDLRTYRRDLAASRRVAREEADPLPAAGTRPKPRPLHTQQEQSPLPEPPIRDRRRKARKASVK